MFQTTACLLSRSNELKMEKRCFTKKVSQFLYAIIFPRNISKFAREHGDKDNFMKEQGNKEPPYMTLIYMVMIVIELLRNSEHNRTISSTFSIVSDS